MKGEDLFCCPSITGQVMIIKKPFLCSDEWLGKSFSDVGQKIPVLIYLFAEKATVNYFVFNISESSFNMPIKF